MKKILRITLPLLVIGLFASTQLATANFGVDIGDTFTFDVVKKERSMTVGALTGTSTGYTVDGHVFADGTSVDVEVLDFDDSFFNETIYEIQAGSYTENDSSSTFGFQLGGLLMVIFPIFISYGFVDVSDWNQTEVEEPSEGLGVQIFVEPETATWEIFKEFAGELQTGTSLISDPAMQNLTLQAEYTDSVTEFSFEAYFGGNFVDVIDNGTHIFNVDYDIEHHFQFAFDKGNGVCKGQRLSGSLEGTSNGTILEMTYDDHVELAGYNLPGYQFGGGFLPGFGWLIAIPVLGLFVAVTTIIRRRK